MTTALLRFCTALLDLFAAPRRSALAVEALTLADLQEHGSEEPLPYRDPSVRALIWELKYRKIERAAALGAQFLKETLIAIASEELGKPLLIPVPIHQSRRKSRGYNQTEFLLEAAIPEIVDFFEYDPKILLRTRATAPQQGLPKYIRLKNVKKSMKVTSPEKINGRVCVVVDDVTTTGATLMECKRALKQAGARSIHCIALARS